MPFLRCWWNNPDSVPDISNLSSIYFVTIKYQKLLCCINYAAFFQAIMTITYLLAFLRIICLDKEIQRWTTSVYSRFQILYRSLCQTLMATRLFNSTIWDQETIKICIGCTRRAWHTLTRDERTRVLENACSIMEQCHAPRPHFYFTDIFFEGFKVLNFSVLVMSNRNPPKPILLDLQGTSYTISSWNFQQSYNHMFFLRYMLWDLFRQY